MNVIFLDFDGVITTVYSSSKLDRTSLDLLDIIVKECDAYIVISSSWRRFTLEDTINDITDKSDYFVDNVEFPNIDRVIGVTSRMYAFKYGINDLTNNNKQRHYGLPRGVEIKRYLEEHSEIENYVILDDDEDMLLEQKDHFIKTCGYKGLTLFDVERAIKILKNETNNRNSNI